MTFIPAFSEPQSRWPRCIPPRPPLANEEAWRARGGSCPSGEPHDPDAPGDDSSPSPVQKSLHTCTTPTNWGRKR